MSTCCYPVSPICHLGVPTCPGSDICLSPRCHPPCSVQSHPHQWERHLAVTRCHLGVPMCPGGDVCPLSILVVTPVQGHPSMGASPGCHLSVPVTPGCPCHFFWSRRHLCGALSHPHQWDCHPVSLGCHLVSPSCHLGLPITPGCPCHPSWRGLSPSLVSLSPLCCSELSLGMWPSPGATLLSPGCLYASWGWHVSPYPADAIVTHPPPRAWRRTEARPRSMRGFTPASCEYPDVGVPPLLGAGGGTLMSSGCLIPPHPEDVGVFLWVWGGSIGA